MCRRTFRGLGCVESDVVFPTIWHVVFVKDRFGRTFGNTGSAVDAFIGVDVDHGLVVACVKTLDRANG